MPMRTAAVLAAVLAGTAWSLTVAPGVATEEAAGKLESLGTKYEMQLENCEEKFRAKAKEYETKVCEGLGCEPDKLKRAKYQIEWDGIIRSYKTEKGKIVKLLAMCFKAKDSLPLRRHFAEWIADQKLKAESATVWNVERELQCEDYTMSYEELGGGMCGRPGGGPGIAAPKPEEQPAACIPMPTKTAIGKEESDEEAAAEAPYLFHCARQCECLAMCDLASGCTHAAFNGDEMSDTTKPNCVLYGGPDCTPDGEGGWKAYAPE